MKTFYLIVAKLLLTTLCVFASPKEKLFPDVTGWKLTVDEKTYTTENLFDIIDGAADLYLDYGFVNLNTASYKKSGIEIRAELYKHNTTKNAFGIYSQERQSSYRFIKIGTEGYIEEGVLNFLCGVYYAKLTTHQKGKATQDALSLIAKAIEKSLNQPKGFPKHFSLFPSKNKQAHSETFINQNFLGYKYFRSAYTADYKGKTKIFFIDCDIAPQAIQVMHQYLQTIKHSDVITDERMFSVDDPNQGKIIFTRANQFLCGVMNFSDAKSAEKLLIEMKKTVKKHFPR